MKRPLDSFLPQMDIYFKYIFLDSSVWPRVYDTHNHPESLSQFRGGIVALLVGIAEGPITHSPGGGRDVPFKDGPNRFIAWSCASHVFNSPAGSRWRHRRHHRNRF